MRSVTKITKEKTAKIIPNAVGVCTEDDVKHIFASLLSRDTTFKLMTRLWKRAIRGAGRIEEDLILPDAVSMIVRKKKASMQQLDPQKVLDRSCNPKLSRENFRLSYYIHSFIP